MPPSLADNFPVGERCGCHRSHVLVQGGKPRSKPTAATWHSNCGWCWKSA
jgi:hypothetical protein